MNTRNGAANIVALSKALLYQWSWTTLFRFLPAVKRRKRIYAIHVSGCNSFKFNFQSGIDPDTQQEAPLYNPRKDQWNEHFRWSEDGSQIVGLTLVGRATVARLRMNQPNIVVARHVWISAGLHPPPYST